jgi:hypothetical protein
MIPPLGDQPTALVLWHAELLDRLLDRCLLIRLVANDADELGRMWETTVLVSQAMNAAASDPKITPLEFMLGMMHDPSVDPFLRFEAAQASPRPMLRVPVPWSSTPPLKQTEPASMSA